MMITEFATGMQARAFARTARLLKEKILQSDFLQNQPRLVHAVRPVVPDTQAHPLAKPCQRKLRSFSIAAMADKITYL